MKDPKKLFHKISYLQYPLMLLGLFYCCKPTLFGIDSIWMDLNKGLVFFGLAISLSTLQDITKTQEKISKRIFENPNYARIFLWLVVFQNYFFYFDWNVWPIFFFQPSPKRSCIWSYLNRYWSDWYTKERYRNGGTSPTHTCHATITQLIPTFSVLVSARL
jgi:magnesium-transporting ATPase (P-type)